MFTRNPRACLSMGTPPYRGPVLSVGLRQKTPQTCAGTRSDPPPSAPSSNAVMPAATSRSSATRAATRRTFEPMTVFALRIEVAPYLMALEVGWYVRLAKNDAPADLIRVTTAPSPDETNFSGVSN